jgi:hypothetical protein
MTDAFSVGLYDEVGLVARAFACLAIELCPHPFEADGQRRFAAPRKLHLDVVPELPEALQILPFYGPQRDFRSL